MHASGSPNPNIERDHAWHCLRCHLRLWIVLVAVLAADLLSKHYAFAILGEPPLREDQHTIARARDVIPGVLEFVTQYNQGAALGILRGHVVLFVVVGVAALAVFLAFFARSGRKQWFFQTGVALVLAGALGNIYDRVVSYTDHQVRDFIHITTRGSRELIGRWPADGYYPWVFNIADMALVVGVIMIVLSSARRPKPDTSEPGEKRQA
ncbi:MAG: signal peptidase II [Phycisphaerae bacterium]|nr:signal peptidase II [Phycisphaerae bacterium]